MPSLLPIGGTIQLNASPGGAATIVPLAEGGFAAVYRIAGGEDVFTLYDDNFNALTSETPIIDDDFPAPQAAALNDGQFVVVWLDDEQSIEASIYNPDGSLAAGDISLANPTDTDVGLGQPGLVGNAFGGLTVIWQDNATINGVTGTVFVQTYDREVVLIAGAGEHYPASRPVGVRIIGSNQARIDEVVGDDIATARERRDLRVGVKVVRIAARQRGQRAAIHRIHDRIDAVGLHLCRDDGRAVAEHRHAVVGDAGG